MGEKSDEENDDFGIENIDADAGQVVVENGNLLAFSDVEPEGRAFNDGLKSQPKQIGCADNFQNPECGLSILRASRKDARHIPT